MTNPKRKKKDQLSLVKKITKTLNKNFQTKVI